MSSRSGTVPLGLFLVLFLLFAVMFSCNQQRDVTLHGEPVTEPVFMAAVTTVHMIEVGSAALGDGIIAFRQGACNHLAEPDRKTDGACTKATDMLRTYTRDVYPKYIMTLMASREQLQLAGKKPPATTVERLQTALTALGKAANELRIWSQQHNVPTSALEPRKVLP